jgi:hypothetical protein
MNASFATTLGRRKRELKMEKTMPCNCDDSKRLVLELEMARIDEGNAQLQFAECNQEKACGLEMIAQLEAELLAARAEIARLQACSSG